MTLKLDKKTYIVLGVGIFLLWILIQFVYLPKLSKVKNLQSSLQSNKQRNLRINDLGHDKEFFENLLNKVALYHDEVRSLMPKEIKLSGLLRELSVLAKKNDVTLLSIRPLDQSRSDGDRESGKDTVNEPFQSANIEIVLECRYEDLGRYVQAVENNNLTVMTIKNIHITSEGNVEDPSNLHVVLVIEAFYKG
jgi:Tfp pilus assembly protein PilO